MARILIPDLQPGARYAIQLRSNDGESVSSWSTIQYIDIDPGTIGPANVTGLVWEDAQNSFHGTWNAVTLNSDGSTLKDFSHYEVVVSAGGQSATYNILERVVPQFTLTYEENLAVFGDPEPVVSIAVKAVNKSGVKSLVAATATATNPPPEPPTNLVGTAYTNQIALSWDASVASDVVAYTVHRGNSSGFVPADGNEIWAGAALDAVDYSTDYNTDHYYKVAAIDAFGTESTYATFGPIRPLGIAGSIDETPPDNPTGVAASVATNTDTSGQFVDLTVAWTGPTPAADSSLSHFNVRYGYDGTTWNYVQVPRDELSTKISRVLAGGSIYVQVQAVDYTANDSAWVNASTYPVNAPKDSTFTETPAAPTASKGVQRILVSHSMNASPSGTLPLDLDYFEVYASTTNNFTASTSNMIGTMKVGGVAPSRVAMQVFDIPATNSTGTTQTWYVKVRGVDKAGNFSPYSAQTSAAVDLILTANIGDAQIVNAKIIDLAADKITAGSGIINDITVKSKLTLGDASTTGAIETFGYVAGSTGARFDKNLIEINQGSIAAAALRIQNSPNILPIQYTSFEYSSGYYTEINRVYPANVTTELDTTQAKFELQSLKVNFAAAVSGKRIYLSSDIDNYNVSVEPGVYIFSIYMKNNDVTSHTAVMEMNLNNTTTLSSSSVTIAQVDGWKQHSYAFTVPSGVSRANISIFITDTNAGSINFDGAMLERKTGSDNTPSPWKPSGITKINGGSLETGTIKGIHIESETIEGTNIVGDTIEGKHISSDFIYTTNMTAIDPENPLSNKVVTGPQGITLFSYKSPGEYDPIITLPTDPDSIATFRGSVITEEISVLNGATFRSKANELARSGEFVLSGGTTKPSAGPSVSFAYDSKDFNIFSDEEVYGLTKGHDGRWYTYVQERATGTYYDTIVSMDPTTGSTNWTWTKTDGFYPEGGIVYSSTYDRYYMLSRAAVNGAWYVETYRSDRTLVERDMFMPQFTTPQWNKYTIGYDFNTNQVLIMAADPANNTLRLWRIPTSASGVDFTTWSIFNDTGTYTHPMSAVLAGMPSSSSGLGSQDRVVYVGRTSQGKWQIRTTNLATGFNAEYSWPYAGDVPTAGAWWDGTNFWGLGTDGIVRKYEGGSHFWNSTTTSDIWYAANNYRDTNTNVPEGTLAAHTALWGGVHASCNGLHETDLGTKTSFTMRKRAKLIVTANDLPNYNLQNDPLYLNAAGSDDPIAYGYYIGRPATIGAAITNTNMKLAAQPAAGVLSITVSNFDFAGTTNASTLTNTFPPAEPARIKSNKMRSDGVTPLLSLDADGIVNAHRLHLASTVDANTNSGNMPALLVGDLATDHLRIDGNEIQAMASDTVPGTLIMNQGGGAVQFGPGVSGISRLNHGKKTDTTDANGRITVSHALGDVPAIVLATPEGGGLIRVFSMSSTNIVFECLSAVGNIQTGVSRVFYWMAIRG